jgi:hypothetical protein
MREGHQCQLVAPISKTVEFVKVDIGEMVADVRSALRLVTFEGNKQNYYFIRLLA